MTFSRALNIYDPADDKKAAFDFINSDNELGVAQRELRLAFNGGSGTVQLPGPLAFWHNGQRAVLGKRFADLDTALGNEVTNRQTAITDEVTARDAAIKVEKDRAMLAESGLQTAITNEVTNRGTAITGEVTARDAAIKVEKDRAVLAEGGLQTQISNLLSNTDGVALNSLAEIVADYKGAGTTAGTRFTDIEAVAATTTTDLNAAVVRIAALEAIINALIASPTAEGVSEGLPVETPPPTAEEQAAIDAAALAAYAEYLAQQAALDAMVGVTP